MECSQLGKAPHLGTFPSAKRTHCPLPAGACLHTPATSSGSLGCSASPPVSHLRRDSACCQTAWSLLSSLQAGSIAGSLSPPHSVLPKIQLSLLLPATSSPLNLKILKPNQKSSTPWTWWGSVGYVCCVHCAINPHWWFAWRVIFENTYLLIHLTDRGAENFYPLTGSTPNVHNDQTWERPLSWTEPNCVFYVVPETQLVELSLLPPNVSIARKLESGVRARNRTQALRCGIQSS